MDGSLRHGRQHIRVACSLLPPPAPAERKRVIDKHTNLATALLKHIKASSGSPSLKLHAPHHWIGSLTACYLH